MEQARLASMNDAAITEAALQDTDNPPLSAAELACTGTRGVSARFARKPG